MGDVNVVVCGAHPDDVEIVAGGTILRLTQAGGHDVTAVVVSDGARGAATDIDPAEIVATRDREARAAAELAGMAYRNLGFPDGVLEDSPELRQALVRELRAAEAELVIAPPPDDYNPDHIAVSHAVTAACLWAAAPGFTDEGPVLAAVPRLYYAAAIGGFGEQPTTFVDITDTFERKLELLRAHESQFALSSQLFQGVDLIRLASVTDAFRGLQAGVEFAEAFRPALRWPRVGADEALMTVSSSRTASHR